ncbi:MAG: HAD-IIA family hydrolase [Bacillota bacterium]
MTRPGLAGGVQRDGVFPWQSFSGYIFDLDGTVYLGERLLPEADRVIAALRASGRRVVFLSNKPLQSRISYAVKLTRLGIPTGPDDVITSSVVLARELSTRHAGKRAYVLGEPPLIDELRQAGVVVVEDPESCGWHVDFVVAAFDRTLSWEKLNHAHQALRRGARLIATNPDRTCPVEGGDVPDAGAIIAALEACSGKALEWVAGKPSHLMVQTALAHLGSLPSETVLVGDRLETDIAMARQAGIASVLVLTGVTDQVSAGRAPAELRPDFVLGSIAELVPVAEGPPARGG